MEILVVGSIAYDSVETPAGKRESQLGGSASYFSVSASYFTKVGMIGVIGSDFDTNDKLMFEEHDIDTSGLIHANGKTFRWSGAYMEDINNAVTIDTQLNVFSNFEPVLSDAHANAPYLFLANIDPKLQLKVLDSMNGRPNMVANDTMNLWIEIARPSLLELIRNVDSIFINEEEAKQLTGKDHLPDAANAILELGPESTVIKRGEYGASVFGDDFSFAAPAYPITRVVDPTGAGDCFAGGFMGYLASIGKKDQDTLRTAAIVGSTMASFACEDFGIDRIKNLTQIEIKDRFNRFIDLTRFKPLT
ncbi:MAG: sugar kinase [SAR202 cluster bacterium]|nr:sugar kinase [Chloroflexota bacterium]MQG87513.1 sugar kinase [SAR202 cluster bacterium]